MRVPTTTLIRSAILLTGLLLGLAALGCGPRRGTGGGGSDEDPSGRRGDSVTVTVGPEGGEVALAEAALTIPPGALDEPTDIVVTEFTGVSPEGLEAVSAAYVFEPEGLTFAVPAALAITADGEPPEGASIYRAEDDESPYEAIETAWSGQTAGAAIEGFSSYVIAGPRRRPSGGSFEVDGVTYSPAPVTNGDVPGFGYDHVTSVGVNDRAGAGGRVWYGDDTCATFRTDGTGIMDVMGGRDDDYASFPTIFYEGGIGVDRLDPDYARIDSLLHFQWGVRLDSDGQVYRTFDNKIEIYVLFPEDERRSGDHRFDEDGPEIYGVMDSPTQDPPLEHDFCVFREELSEQTNPPPNCRERDISYNGRFGDVRGDAVERRCFAGGMLDGEYTVTLNGTEVVRGEWKENLRVGGWTYWSTEGLPLRSGQFHDDGVEIGTWETYRPAGWLSEEESWGGTLHSDDAGYIVYREGPSTVYASSSGDIPPRTPVEEGSWSDNHKTGWWIKYNSLSDPGRPEEACLYDADRLRERGERCGQGGCVPRTESLKERCLFFDYPNECTPSNDMTEVFYDGEGQDSHRACFSMEPQDDGLPRRGSEKECGGVCQE